MVNFIKRRAFLLLCAILLPAAVLVEDVRVFALSFSCLLYIETPEYALAYPMCRLAAEHGDADAQFELGEMYQYGEGVAVNWRDAVQWYRRSAEQGYAEAQYRMGMLHIAGKGVAKDADKAIEWMRLAAMQGHGGALEMMGDVYLDGEEVAQDFQEAYVWYSLAAESDWVDVDDRLERVRKELTEEEILEADEEVVRRGEGFVY